MRHFGLNGIVAPCTPSKRPCVAFFCGRCLQPCSPALLAQLEEDLCTIVMAMIQPVQAVETGSLMQSAQIVRTLDSHKQVW